MQDPSSNSEPENRENTVGLQYQYLEAVLKAINESLNALNTKASALIGFDALVINFATNLPNQYLIFKAFTFASLMVSVLMGILAYAPKEAGTMVKPKVLMDNHYYDSEENFRLVVIKTWIEGLPGLCEMRDKKFKFLKYGIWSLGAAALVTGYINLIVLICGKP
jgi:hypothetical protein